MASGGAVLGGAGKSGAQPAQPGDFLASILEDHALFKDYIITRIPGLMAAGDVPGLKAARDELTARLSAHTSIEERTIQAYYAADLAAEVLKEDVEEKRVVDRFMRAAPEDMRAFGDSFAALQRVVLNHMVWEESVGFPSLRANLPAELQAKLAKEMAELRAGGTLPTRPHPLGPSAGLGAKIVHPAAGLIDRAVDAVTGRHVGSAASGGAGGDMGR
jgi:hypothetical protein